MNISFKNSGRALALSAVICAVCSCGSNTTTSSTTTDSTTTATAVDKTAVNPTADSLAAAAVPADTMSKDAGFVTDVAKANAGEIKMLQSGIDNGTNKMLKADAKKMIADHKDLESKMKDYASKKSIAWPNTDAMPDMSSLDGKTGKDWDKAWTDMMVDGHSKTTDHFNQGQNEVTDPELKDMITKTLPTLHKHLDMVTKLQGSMN